MSQTQDRAAIITRARQILESPYLVLDTETTGLDTGSEIVDIGIVDHQGQVLLESLVKPMKPIPSRATAVHGITDAMVAQAPSWSELWPEISDIFSDNVLGVYNEEFDLKMLRASCVLNGIAWQPSYRQSFCIMKMFSQFYGEWNDYFGDYRWQKLEFAGQELGIQLPNTHRAADDALLAREVLRALAAVDQ